MSHTFSNSLYHLVWSTKNREPHITKEIKPRLYSYIRAVIKDEGANLLYINGIEDHIHLLVAMPLTLLVPSLVQIVKPTSTKWFNRTFETREFKWQAGYGAFSVGNSNLQGVINYIKNQEEHHKTVTFKEEFIGMLQVLKIPYDPRFCFD